MTNITINIRKILSYKRNFICDGYISSYPFKSISSKLATKLYDKILEDDTLTMQDLIDIPLRTEKRITIEYINIHF